MEPDKIIYWIIQEQRSFSDLNWLTISEELYLQTLRFPKRREEWLAGRWLAKNLLVMVSDTLSDTPLNEISIEKKSDGSPFAVWKGNILPGSISISHRSGFIAAAWTPCSEFRIGIDLELVEPKAISFIEDYFTRNEKETVLNQEPEKQACVSSLIWSAKEAVMKAMHTGLSIDTRQVEFGFFPVDHNITWQSLCVLHYPEKSNNADLYWQRQGEIIISLAVLSQKEQLERLPKIKIKQIT